MIACNTDAMCFGRPIQAHLLCCRAMADYNPRMAQRFRGYLPVIVDIETSGFDCKTNALLEIAMVTIAIDDNGWLKPAETIACHVEPFENAVIEPRAIEFNGIDPFSPLRGALPEKVALQHCFNPVRKAMKESGCKRAILVAHNAAFDHGFLSEAVARTGYKRNPFHPFSTLDTVTLAALAYGETVLARAAVAAGLEWDHREAHSAIYDAEGTAEIFCRIMNRWKEATGFWTPEPAAEEFS